MELEFIYKVIYFYLIGFFLAVLEIQIEGPHGWAEKLPTWRPKQGSKVEKFFKKIMTDKELTGYHSVLNIFLLLFLHWPFVWNWHWNVFEELEILSIFVLFVVVWDFLWFVLNPGVSLRDFGPKRVWWHKKWKAGVPADYWSGILFSIVLFLPETIVVDPIIGIAKILILLLVNLILTTLTIALYPKAY